MHDADLSINPTASSIAALVGDDALEQLSVTFGGRRIYIPRQPGANSPIAIVIGLDAANKISEVYGGMEFLVPLRAGNRLKVLELRQQGVPIARIPHILRISRSTVYEILAAEQAKNQMDLFD